MAKPTKKESGYSSTSSVSVTRTAPARSNAGGVMRGKARAAQVQAMNVTKKATRKKPA